ncbi:J domain-containing protein [Dyella amyloliquefaciens]|uniref:J domain-containing protein n=1 Tax=Dyella amyloliquefaciens TaxID=1770545 RepID=UPI0013EE6C1A|nr:DnaJ domain-containing protein [Dyella amyloliquefaciens]
MTRETDFLDLYRQLGLSPGCDLAELKQAYRRRVAMLHPDRRPNLAIDARASARLQRLTAQYGAAMDFHRRHGRLPGAPVTRDATSDVFPAVADPFAASRTAPPLAGTPFHPVSEVAAAKRRTRGRVAVVLVVVALGVFAWNLYSASFGAGAGSVSEDDTQSSDAATVAQDDAPDAPALRLGMSADEVRAIEGDPVSTHGDLWEYGPSWVRFDRDQVVDWHSSPLRALHTGDRPAQITGH